MIQSTTFTPSRRPMISAQHELTRFRYALHQDSQGNRWFVPDSPYASENIYVEIRSTRGKSRGMAGSMTKFKLVTGDIVEIQGPWHTTSESLLKTTGVDVTNTHRTFCVIAKRRKYVRGEDSFEEVLYKDPQPVVGRFARPEILAKAEAFADTLGHTVYLYKESLGGRSAMLINPMSDELGNRRMFVPCPNAGNS